MLMFIRVLSTLYEQEHLAHPPAGRVPLIAFLVHTRQLVHQQSALFKRFLPCRVVEIVGQASGEGSAIPLRSQLSDEPVMFVMIASLLVNALRPGPDAIKSICEFSLIFIDECHHTMLGAQTIDLQLFVSSELSAFKSRLGRSADAFYL